MARAIDGVETAQANVLELNTLPDAWTRYDLIVSASMLEYVPRDRFAEALSAVRGRLREDGRFVLFITRRNWLTRPLIGRWWQANLYSAAELRDAFCRAGFSRCSFQRFPPAARYLANIGLFLAAPFIGLAYAVAFPFIGIALLVGRAARRTTGAANAAA